MLPLKVSQQEVRSKTIKPMKPGNKGRCCKVHNFVCRQIFLCYKYMKQILFTSSKRVSVSNFTVTYLHEYKFNYILLPKFAHK